MQGPNAAAAEGRMAAVGMIYNPVPDDPACWTRPHGRPPRFQARYVASLEGQASLAEPLRRQAAWVGMDRAQRWIALSDAGTGVEDSLRVNFGRVDAVILDFYHAAEHLGELARALYPGDEATRENWLEHWSHRLKHEGGVAVLDALRALPPDHRESVRTIRGEVVGYFENHVHRMDYPRKPAEVDRRRHVLQVRLTLNRPSDRDRGCRACAEPPARPPVRGGSGRELHPLKIRAFSGALLREGLPRGAGQPEEALEAIARHDRPGTLIDCDPPYEPSTRTARTAYRFEMTAADHARLLEVLNGLRHAAVMLSGYRCDLYDSALAGWRPLEWDMPNHAGQGRAKGRRTECLWPRT